MTNAELATRLRAFAQVYDDNPEARQFHGGTSLIFCHDKVSTAATLRAFGPGTKEDDGNSIKFHPTDFPELTIHVFKSNVCERIKVGEREVLETVTPAKPAIKKIVVPAHVEEVFEWRCGSLLDATPEQAEVET